MRYDRPGEGSRRDRAGGDGPASDGRASDAPADAFDQTAACADYALCDSFEGPDFANVWTVGTRVTLDTSDVLPATTLGSSVTESDTQPLHDLSVGLGMSGTNVDVAQPAMDMWVDDAIVDPNPPTCED